MGQEHSKTKTGAGTNPTGTNPTTGIKAVNDALNQSGTILEQKAKAESRRGIIRELMHTKIPQTAMLETLNDAGIVMDKSTLSRDLRKIREEDAAKEKQLSLRTKQERYIETLKDLFRKSIVMYTQTNKNHEKLKNLEFCLKCEMVIAETQGIRRPIEDDDLSHKDSMSYVEEYLKTRDGDGFRKLSQLFKDSLQRWKGDGYGRSGTGQVGREEDN